MTLNPAAIAKLAACYVGQPQDLIKGEWVYLLAAWANAKGGLPAAPVAIPATNLADTSFSANWNASPNGSGYLVDVTTDPTFGSFVPGYQNKIVGNVLTVAVTGLTAGTTYYYRVKATSGTGQSGYSNVITAATTGLPVLPAPSISLNVGADSVVVGNSGAVNNSGGVINIYVSASISQPSSSPPSSTVGWDLPVPPTIFQPIAWPFSTTNAASISTLTGLGYIWVCCVATGNGIDYTVTPVGSVVIAL